LQSVPAERLPQKVQTSPSSPKIVSENRITRQGKESARSLTQQLDDPQSWPTLKKSTIMTRFSRWNRAWLLRFQQQGGFQSLNSTLTWLIENARQEDLALPLRSDLVLTDDRPDALIGGSGVGKTLAVKTLLLPALKATKTCLLVLDTSAEYAGIPRISLPDIFTMKWNTVKEGTWYRFVPNENSLLADAEIAMLFQRLNSVKLEGFVANQYPSGALRRWIFVAEEAHRLIRSTAFMDFVSESRKYLRKILIITNNPGPFSQTCRVLVPPPLEELLNQQIQGES
jgi:hypothetical protein